MTQVHIIKEMEYHDTHLRPAQILATGVEQRRYFIVVNMGTHPCAYIRIPRKSPFYQKHYDSLPAFSFFPNGGFTFSDNLYSKYFDQPIKEGWYLGWDYAHVEDFLPFSKNGKKHTTEEIIEETKKIINALKERENEFNAIADEAQAKQT